MGDTLSTNLLISQEVPSMIGHNNQIQQSAGAPADSGVELTRSRGGPVVNLRSPA
jgi:hypothetical protein